MDNPSPNPDNSENYCPTCHSVGSLRIRHVPFHPTPLGTNDSPIGRVCAAQERDGWTLLRVIVVNAYEAVAVFGKRAVDDTA